MSLYPDSSEAVALKSALQTGDVEALKKLLSEHVDLATAHIGDATEARSLLHIATDWSGHFPNGPATVRAFLQFSAAQRHVERGAEVDLQDAATLGLMGHLDKAFAAELPPTKLETDWAFCNACHGGQLAAAKLLYSRGADIRVVPPWDGGTPLDVAKRSNAELTEWLMSLSQF